ncbi:hypothetical protein P171DRAFT_196200 [Karstenula rhodostoma CBS 690.94]|uniref:Uncharacterized protein n=1 Tax=Karstenula rhodostoma CBS 690.94 TaxID=1392251 RepID=A0A9P4PVL3_9PLEO|nr:hypothetical protein P171DRAFT_196200 [Karstenula rhodostoma CBS 690.94]
MCVLRNFLLTVKASATSLVWFRGWSQYCQIAGKRHNLTILPMHRDVGMVFPKGSSTLIEGSSNVVPCWKKWMQYSNGLTNSFEYNLIAREQSSPRSLAIVSCGSADDASPSIWLIHEDLCSAFWCVNAF